MLYHAHQHCSTFCLPERGGDGLVNKSREFFPLSMCLLFEKDCLEIESREFLPLSVCLLLEKDRILMRDGLATLLLE